MKPILRAFKLHNTYGRVMGNRIWYSSVLNRSHVATIWNFDPNYSLPNLTQVSLPKMFQIVATWLVFSTEEYWRSKSMPVEAKKVRIKEKISLKNFIKKLAPNLERMAWLCNAVCYPFVEPKITSCRPLFLLCTEKMHLQCRNKIKTWPWLQT